MDDFVIMKFVGASVKILCALNSGHQLFVTKENGVNVLYVRLINTMYGCLKSALLWYELFSGTLKDMGFVLNPYDSCVANCMIQGKQCTIAWYVDNTKISHINPDVVTGIIRKLEERFYTMAVTRGREYVFLEMHTRYTTERTAVITMKDYLLITMKDYLQREHVFLEMHIRYTTERTAVITMMDYLQEAIAEAGLDITKSSSSQQTGIFFTLTNSPHY